MNNYLQEFILAADKCTEHCRKMAGHEQEKRQALLYGDDKRLETVLQTMQSDLMRLEQLEKRRMECQEKAGFESLSADELLEKVPSVEDREKLKACFDGLRDAAEELRFYNSKAIEIAKANLQFISVVEKRNKTVDSAATYKPGQSGKSAGGSSSFTIKI